MQFQEPPEKMLQLLQGKEEAQEEDRQAVNHQPPGDQYWRRDTQVGQKDRQTGETFRRSGASLSPVTVLPAMWLDRLSVSKTHESSFSCCSSCCSSCWTSCCSFSHFSSCCSSCEAPPTDRSNRLPSEWTNLRTLLVRTGRGHTEVTIVRCVLVCVTE